MKLAGRAMVRPRESALGNSGAERADYLRTVSQLLWPEPARVRALRSDHGRLANGSSGNGRESLPGPTSSELIVLPSHRDPRLLIPTTRLAAAAAISRYAGSGSSPARFLKRFMSLAMATNVGPRLFRDRLVIDAPSGSVTINSYLRETLGRDLRISLHVTGARANRKPLLQLLTPEGEALGFAKIGADLLTCGLIRAEGEALAQLARLRLQTFTVPRVLHHGTLNGLEVLVLTPLPMRLRRGEAPWDRLNAATLEIAGATQQLARESIAQSAQFSRLQVDLLSAPATAERAALETALHALGERDGETTLTYGCSHGDFSPWNMASDQKRLWVWDWERFTVGVPLGFDLLHFWLQREVSGRRRQPPRAAAELVRRAHALLEPLGVPAHEASLTARLYLAELSARYLRDGQEEAGAELGNPGWWLIPAINGEVPR